jgi:hypothetical protein
MFVPCLLCFLQGQDSLLLLLMVVLAFAALRRGRHFACGLWLGLGLFKFELVLPMALVLILTTNGNARRDFAKGFGLMAVSLAALSAAVSGLSIFTVYPHFLLSLRAQPLVGITPRAMANFRGLASWFLHGHNRALAVIAITICSVVTLLKAVNDWRGAQLTSRSNGSLESYEEFDLAFANTVLFALLVSFHLNPHDLSLLLLPVILLFKYGLKGAPTLTRRDWIANGLIAILFLPPLHLWALQAGIYVLVGVFVIALFLIIDLKLKNSTPLPPPRSTRQAQAGLMPSTRTGPRAMPTPTRTG